MGDGWARSSAGAPAKLLLSAGRDVQDSFRWIACSCYDRQAGRKFPAGRVQFHSMLGLGGVADFELQTPPCELLVAAFAENLRRACPNAVPRAAFEQASYGKVAFTRHIREGGVELEFWRTSQSRAPFKLHLHSARRSACRVSEHLASCKGVACSKLIRSSGLGGAVHLELQ